MSDELSATMRRAAAGPERTAQKLRTAILRTVTTNKAAVRALKPPTA
jgi:hypothetical protein